MNAPIRDEDEVKRRTAHIITEINQHQLTRALHSSSSVYVDPDEGRE
ncbi:MAG: hypothetical protein JRE82_00380 [Deltaproteobacteria bacterium]|nr:hypothetical protein [Deltaproteobacteria bacterium]